MDIGKLHEIAECCSRWGVESWLLLGTIWGFDFKGCT